MEDYKSNSDKEKQLPKKVEAVVSETATTRKKGEFRKVADSFIAEDATNVGAYILREVVVPAVKKVVSDVITNSVDMFLYGEPDKSRKTSSATKVSYRSYYGQDSDRYRPEPSNRRGNLDYDEIVFRNRGDAEAVLDSMNDIISQYGAVSVSDLYDLARVSYDNYTMNRYGWTNIGGAQAVRVRDGYVLKLPRPIPLN